MRACFLRNSLLALLSLLWGWKASCGQIFPALSATDTTVSSDFLLPSDSLVPDFNGQGITDLDRYFSGLAEGSSFDLSGFLSLGADWGLTQDLNTTQTDKLRYWAQGELRTELVGIPVMISGQYFQQAIRPETQNFIRIAFDREALTSKKDELSAHKLKLVGLERFKLMDRMQDVDMQSSYLSTLAMYPQGTHDLNAFPSNLYPSGVSTPATLATPGISGSSIDELVPQNDLSTVIPEGTGQSMMDSLRIERFRQDLNNRRQQLQDSLNRLNQYEASLNQVNGPNSLPYEKSNGVKQWLEGIQAFQLGQVVPTFSTFIVAPQPMNGVYTKYESSTREFAVVHGQVLADMRPPQDRRSAWLQQITSEVIPVGTNIGDRVTAGMISVWKREGSFLRFNVMSGIDKWNENPQDARPNAAPFGRNAAAEIEGKAIIAKGHSIEAVYAYSSTANTEMTDLAADSERNSQSIANSAARVRWTGEWSKIGMKASAEGKVIGGNFRSLSNPFLREDQGTYELHARKDWKRGEVELTHKFRRNNISSLTPTSTTLSQWLLKYNHRLGKKWKLSAMIAPMNVRVEDADRRPQSELRGRQIVAVATRLARVGKTVQLWQVVYTDMLLNDEMSSVRNEMKEFASDYRLTWENGWTINPSAMGSVFIGMDSKEMNRLLRGAMSISKTISSAGTIEFAGSWLVQHGERPQPGYRAALIKTWKNGLEAAIISEKVVMENFFSDEVLALYRNNPYRCQAKLTYSF